MLETSRNAVFFQWFVCRVSRKVGLLKRRVRRSELRGEIKNCTPLWRKAQSEVKMYKTWRVRSTFVSSDVEKMHAAVAKSTFWSENVQNTSAPKHFLLFSRRKNARCCGEKHMWKWKCTKHEVFGHFCKFRCRKNARRCGEKHILKWKCTKHVSSEALFALQP